MPSIPSVNLAAVPHFLELSIPWLRVINILMLMSILFLQLTELARKNEILLVVATNDCYRAGGIVVESRNYDGWLAEWKSEINGYSHRINLFVDELFQIRNQSYIQKWRYGSKNAQKLRRMSTELKDIRLTVQLCTTIGRIRSSSLAKPDIK
ncbi:hypothetical protein BDQ12DRAFT_688355 [Crucibulum laeve]|uniref:Uncharacterized protein n=1 Tax=Crucibulum laeve TaxID=68775 RepID=A0A5C3LRD4_9AGAR|nr:hypothetical protein BDQ12DRAFT_688355 [Crucibulum laeve]